MKQSTKLEDYQKRARFAGFTPCLVLPQCHKTSYTPLIHKTCNNSLFNKKCYYTSALTCVYISLNITKPCSPPKKNNNQLRLNTCEKYHKHTLKTQDEKRKNTKKGFSSTE